MRDRLYRGASCAVVAIASVLAFCGTASAKAQPVPVMYVSDVRADTVGVYRLADGRLAGTIAYPMDRRGMQFATGVGIATDRAGNLWAAFAYDDGQNYPGKIIIYGYAPGNTKWFTTIRGGCCGSPNLAVSARGEIAQALGYFPPDYGGGVGFVEPGKRFVGRYNIALLGAIYDTYDASGRLWVGGVDAGFNTHVGFIARGSATFQEVGLQPAARLGPLAVDVKGNLLVCNDATLSAYDQNGALVYRTALLGASGVTGIALSRDGTVLYVAASSGSVLTYAFPAGGMPLRTYNVGGRPYAIALGAI